MIIWVMNMYIQCENRLCIYFHRSQCSLSSICLDQTGICQSGIEIEIEESFLEDLRKSLQFRLGDNPINWEQETDDSP